MSRPRDWSPLAGSDPVPGEPETISDEARRLRDMATEMRSQISRLRAIGHDDNEGLYADKLRVAATDLAGKLEKIVGRYQRVAGALSGWAPELVHAQTESVRALERAQAAEATRAANTVIRAVPQPGDPPPTPAEQARERRREATLDEAARDLAAARRQLDDAVEHAQSKGRHYAGRIKDAIEDDVKDSWWDNVKDWVDRHADLIKLVTKVLSYVVTALAIVALFIPGVNILVAVLVLGGFLLAGQTLLAASGNGSWVDVGLTVFALATFGLGPLAAAGLRGAQVATRAVGAQAARTAARSAAQRSSSAARTAAGRTLARRSASAAQRRGARRSIDAAHRQARTAGNRAAREVRDAPQVSATLRDTLRAGGRDAARDYNGITAMRARFPGDPGVAHTSRNAELLHNTGAGAFAAGTAADVVDKVGEDAGIEPYKDAKKHFTKEVGSTW